MFKRLKKWQQSHSIDAHIRDILINTISSLFAAAIVTTGGLVIAPPGPIHAFILANFAWLLACTLLFILAVSMSIYAVVLQRERAARLIELPTQLNDQFAEVVNSLFSRLPGLVVTRDLHSFIHEMLADTTQLIPSVYGSSLYRPDGPDFLTIWEAYEVPEDSRKNARCYIGPNPNIKRGVAGECFCENKDIIVAHSTNQVDRHHNWIFDQESYIHFGRPGTHPAFVSFICIPVFVDKANMLGVLC